MRRALDIVVLLATCLLVSSCGGGDSSQSSLALKGFVTADDPIVGAEVVAVGPLGDTLSGPVITNQLGAFHLPVLELPKGASVRAKGGTYRGTPFSGTVVAKVRDGFNPRVGVIYLNPATTLAAAHHDSHALRTSLADAEDHVRRFLGMPFHTRLSHSKRHNPDQFSARAFMTQAVAYRDGEGAGFDRFVQYLSAQADAGATRRFTASAPQAAGVEAEETSLAVTGLKWVLEKLAGGIVGGAGATAFNKILDGATGSPDLSEVQSQLDTINNQLTNLENQVATLGDQLGCDITSYGYADLVGGDVQSKFDTVKNLQASLDHLAAITDTTSTEFKNEEADIEAGMQANLSIHTDIYYFIAGNPSLGTKGAVRGLAGMITSCGHFFNAAKSDSIAQQYLYLSGLMRSACILVINYRTKRDETADAQDATDDCYNTYIPGVVNLATPNAIPAGSTDVIDVRYNLMWRYFGLSFGNQMLPSGTFTDVYVADLTSQAANTAAATGKTWYVPAIGDVGGFITPCYTQGLRDCLAKNGFGTATYDETTKTTTYTNYYGAGDIYLWNNSQGRRGSDGAQYSQWADWVINPNGTHNYVECYCAAGVMLLRPLDTGEAYWLTMQ